MDSFRRLFGHADDGVAARPTTAAAAANDVGGRPATHRDAMEVDSDRPTRPDHDDDVEMPELLEHSDSSDDEDDDTTSPSTSSAATVAQPQPLRPSGSHSQISPVDRVPDRRPRVEDVIDDDDRARRTPTLPPTPAAVDGQPGSDGRPIRPLPRAFQSGRRLPIPMAGSYVMQGVSFSLPMRNNLQQQPAPPQAGLVEPLAATPAPPTPPATGNINPNAPGANQNPPAWLTGMLASIMNTLAQNNAQQTNNGLHGASMNFLFPDVGVAASATARQAPRPSRTSTPVQGQAGPAPSTGTPAPAPAPADQNPEAAFAEFQRMHTEAMRALHLRAQQRQNTPGNAQAQQQGAPAPQAVPVPVPVPIPFPFPFAFGGAFGDEPAEDPGQARRLIEGLEEVPAGLVKRYMRVEKETDGGTGACAVCWEGLDAGLEEGGEAAPRWQSDADGSTTATAEDNTSAASDAAPQPTEEPLRSRIVVLPCGHAFHSVCLQPWFSQHTTCPNCRYNVDPEGLASTAYVNGRRRAGAGHMPHVHFNAPPPAFFADLMAQLTGQGPPAQNPQPPQQNAATPNTPPAAPANHRFTFNLGPFPMDSPPAPPVAQQQQQEGAPAGLPPLPSLPHFPITFWPPAPGQAQASPPGANGPRIHHHHHHHHIADGVETHYDTFEVELDIGVTVPLGSPGTSPQQQQQQQQQQQTPSPGTAPFDMFFHFVAPMAEEVPRTPQQPQQAGSPQQQTPPANANATGTPTAFPRLPSFRDFAAAANAPTTRPARRKWARPDAQGRTIRQHVEQRERDLGLRCEFISCDLAPTDDDPTPDVAPTRTIRLHTGPNAEKKCGHAFHPQCIVTAARVAAVGDGRDAPDASVVSCPLCRVEGAVDPDEWAEGERALQAQLEA